ncbi:hypothetical protein [Ruegeria lacuscaerulensis]|uniref:hypothetical protein n=1 Tax=Ruegeria lacuscaerulensis TaxID=55218 RepID=UPI001BE476F8|nr:hypothetical protein [Ruegeria lacuscaerulensis]
MMMQQVAYAVVGKDAAVSLASFGGKLEIDHFKPVIASRMFDSMKLLTRGSLVFADIWIMGIVALAERGLENPIGPSALAIVFVPKFG